MFSLNPAAPPFIPASYKVPVSNDTKLSSVRLHNAEEHRMEFLQAFDRNQVPDEDL